MNDEEKVKSDDKKTNRKVPSKTQKDLDDEKEFYYNLGTRLQTARVRRKKLQKDVADAIRTSSNTLSMYERGIAKIHAYELQRICEVTGSEPNKLMGIRGKGNIAIDHKIMAKLADMPIGMKKKILAILDIIYPEK